MDKFIEFYEAYIECAFWVNELDPRELSGDETFDVLQDCLRFIEKAHSYMIGLDYAQCGHDFWLTRNGHGSGFWDRDYDKIIGDRLTEIAHGFGEYYILGGEYEQV